MADKALRLLETSSSPPKRPPEAIRKLVIESIALERQQQLSLADQRLTRAESMCKNASALVCGEVTRARGVLDVAQDRFSDARLAFISTLSIAQQYHDKYLETTAALNLGWLAIQVEHFDESVDWSTEAYNDSVALGAEDLAENVAGNLGWAYFKLGDAERALALFVEAGRRAEKLGNKRNEVKWLTTAGNVYQEKGDFAGAARSYTQALSLATELDSQEDVVNALEDLTHSSIDAGRIENAENYVRQLKPMVSGNRLDALDVMLGEGAIAKFQQRWRDAEVAFQLVAKDPASQTSMRMGAEHELAIVYETQRNVAAADRMYRIALTTFASARDRLKDETSKLPFFANATSIYDDYIHFLISQGRSDEALRIADQSRAQTLAQGLGVAQSNSHGVLTLHPGAIARKANATLLFYWLGEKQSYLWAITGNRTVLFPLPPRREIAQTIERYRKTLFGLGDPLERADADGIALYRMLVASASALLPAGTNVVVLNDGELSQLNFETLIVPGIHPHYWIEDATVISAPSLHLLAAANSGEPRDRRLLLFGDAISPNPDYPQLPMAASEMKQIEQHFASRDQTIYAREQATAPAYFAVNPQQFAYIHFVAHGVASRTDPLDSAIILSRANAAEDSFKLHAREIIEHPLHAQLVTISACYGSGTRSYAGEGLVGLAWAFLRAGAHNVIGALWEASDESTAQSMGDLYAYLEKGATPSAALHAAKLNLLHSHGEFRKPFYWAAFQIYTGL